MTAFIFPNAANLIPGQGGPEYTTQENQIWYGRHDQQGWGQGILDKDTVDAGNTGVTTIVRHGLAIGIITASQQLTHWNPYATDGSHRLAGFFAGPGQAMELVGGATRERMVGDVLVHGNVYADRLIIPGETNKGISGKAYEFLLREQMVGRFNVSDDALSGGYQNWKVREATASATLTVKDHKTHFTNLGAVGAITLTLPAPVPGLQFKFTVVAVQDIILEGPATGEYFIGGVTANSDTLVAANEETILVTAIRTAVTPTYQYFLTPVPG